jgi:hypothetical protein
MTTIPEVYDKALLTWGLDAQIKVAIEELAELIVELAKLGRAVNGSTKADIAGEIADVEMMIGQMKYALEIENEVKLIYGQKLAKLMERLKL